MQNTVRIPNNQFFDYAYFDTDIPANSMTKIVKENIISDYQQNGVRGADITVIPKDLKYLNGTIALAWQNGEILQVGDIVQVENEQDNELTESDSANSRMLFRVTGRTFKYNGEPTIYIELMSVR